jgi:hypothetical protein
VVQAHEIARTVQTFLTAVITSFLMEEDGRRALQKERVEAYKIFSLVTASGIVRNIANPTVFDFNSKNTLNFPSTLTRCVFFNSIST